MKKIKYICLTLVAGMITAVLITAFFLGINGSVFAGCLGGLLAIAGYIAARRANGDMPGGLLSSILPLLCLACLATGCKSGQVDVNYPCLVHAASRCCIELSQCFELCTPEELEHGLRGCPVLDVCREGKGLVPENLERGALPPLSSFHPFPGPRSGSPGGGGFCLDFLPGNNVFVRSLSDSIDIRRNPCYGLDIS